MVLGIVKPVASRLEQTFLTSFCLCTLSLKRHLCHHPAPKFLKSFSEIPGPPPLPVIGNGWRYLPGIGEYDIKRMHKNYEKMLKQYGCFVREVTTGTRVILHVFDPEDMAVILHNEGRYPARLSHRALLEYRLKRPEVYKSGGLFPTNGNEWHRMRVLFQKHLLQPDAINPYITPMAEVAECIVRRVKETRDMRQEVEDFQLDLYRWSLESTGILALDRRLGCLDRSLGSDSESERLVLAASATHHAVMVSEFTWPLRNILPLKCFRELRQAQDYMSNVGW